MRCFSPRTVGFAADGKTICWSPKKYSKEYVPFQLPCGKCLECRLDYARQWAVRCVHEAQMHKENSFITLTYSDEKLISEKLNYSDFQKFAKRLRRSVNSPIGYFVTGEYGEKTKRPHWHACIFGWSPPDGTPAYKNERQDQFYHSKKLAELWGNGNCDYTELNFKTAGYCARYAAKKLVHGYDQDHEFHPISKKSSKHAIGKKWLEKYYATDCFNYGQIVLADGATCSIPRYYQKWLKDNKPEEFTRYVTQTKLGKIEFAERKEAQIQDDYRDQFDSRSIQSSKDGIFRGAPVSVREARKKILKQNFKRLQEKLKL